MIRIYPTDVHRDVGKARLGVAAAAEALGVECDCRLASMWSIAIEPKDRAVFIEIAKAEVEPIE